MDKKERLRWQIEAKIERSEKNKTKRTRTAIGIVAAVIYSLFLLEGSMQGPIDHLLGIPAAIIGAGMYFYINMLGYALIFSGSHEENDEINRLRMELWLLEKEESEHNSPWL